MRISDWSSDGGSSDLVRCYAASRAVRSVEGPHVPDAPGVAPRAIRPALVLRSHTVQQCAREHARPRGCFVARQYSRNCVEHGRTEERRVGKEVVRKVKSRVAQDHYKTKHTKKT